MYNTWRSIIYNKKGRIIGFPESWTIFDNFVDDVGGEWVRGRVLSRMDTSLPYSKENCLWVEKGTENIGKLISIEYNGEYKTLLEWSEIYNMSYNGVRQRYFRGKYKGSEYIIFGRKNLPPKQIKDHLDIASKTLLRSKASKMASQYRTRDAKKGLLSDVHIDDLLDAFKKSCVYCGSKSKIGLDRIDNSIGHIKSNVVPCCYNCNVARADNFTHNEMFIIGEAIAKINKLRENENK